MTGLLILVGLLGSIAGLIGATLYFAFYPHSSGENEK